MNNLKACIFRRARAAFEKPYDVDGCLGVWLFVVQCHEQTHLNRREIQVMCGISPSNGKDERNDLLLCQWRRCEWLPVSDLCGLCFVF